MKIFELGQKVNIKKYYQRNGRKPRASSNTYDRYILKDIMKTGFYCGKRKIYVKGYTIYDSEDGYNFYPIEARVVHLVAISNTQLIYVPDEFVDTTTKSVCKAMKGELG